MTDLDMAQRTANSKQTELARSDGLRFEQINPRRTLSPKLLGSLGGAIATMVWIVLANEVSEVSGWATDTVIAATGASATLLTLLLTFLVGDPLRQPLERRSLRRR